MGVKLNPDQEVVKTIKEGLKRTGGYCPARKNRRHQMYLQGIPRTNQRPQFYRVLPLHALLQRQ